MLQYEERTPRRLAAPARGAARRESSGPADGTDAVVDATPRRTVFGRATDVSIVFHAVVKSARGDEASGVAYLEPYMEASRMAGTAGKVVLAADGEAGRCPTTRQEPIVGVVPSDSQTTTQGSSTAWA